MDKKTLQWTFEAILLSKWFEWKSLNNHHMFRVKSSGMLAMMAQHPTQNT